jgi:hypothetical protein
VTFGNGIWRVGSDIPAGLYRNSGGGEWCDWARLSGCSGDLDDILANDFIDGGARVYVQIYSSDRGFENTGHLGEDRVTSVTNDNSLWAAPDPSGAGQAAWRASSTQCNSERRTNGRSSAPSASSSSAIDCTETAIPGSSGSDSSWSRARPSGALS